MRDEFGENSDESTTFAVALIQAASDVDVRDVRANPFAYGYDPDAQQQRRTAASVQVAIGRLEHLLTWVDEKTDTKALGMRVTAAFEGLDLHPRIRDACHDLYRNGHYRNAVLDASVALVSMVKEKSRRQDLDGAGLMSTVFSRKNSVLAFNELKDQTDEDEQEGMMHLFMGVVLALRNPRAQALLDDSPELALEYIGLISLLAKRVDQAKRRADPPR